MESNQKVYVFRDSVRLFDNGSDEIRLRMGVFNYEEVALDLSPLSPSLSEFMRKAFKLMNGDGYDVRLINERLLEPYEKEMAENIFEELLATNYITEKGGADLTKELTLALLGYMEHDDMNTDEDAGKKKLLFYSDDAFARDAVQSLAAQMDMPIYLMDEKTAGRIRTADLTTNMDGLSTVKAVNSFADEFREYDAVIVCLRNLSVLFMRNLNRISIELEIPVIFTFVDGPVICALATQPYATGCLECFELRALSRLEDHVQYHRFAGLEAAGKAGANGRGLIPLMNVLANIAVAEAYLFRKIGVSKFTGRLLTIYLPTLEIQAQDILRAPFCPACGAVAKATLEEKNVSARALVDEMAANALNCVK